MVGWADLGDLTESNVRRQRLGKAGFGRYIRVNGIAARRQVWQRSCEPFPIQLFRMQMSEGVQSRLSHQKEMYELAMIRDERRTPIESLIHDFKAQRPMPVDYLHVDGCLKGAIQTVIVVVSGFAVPPALASPKQGAQQQEGTEAGAASQPTPAESWQIVWSQNAF